MSRKILSPPFKITNPAGLHARPAAYLASRAKTFSAEISLIIGHRKINAKSVVAIMGLSTRYGDKARIEAHGQDARQAVTTLTELIKQICGETDIVAPLFPAVSPGSAKTQATSSMLPGGSASPGISPANTFPNKGQQRPAIKTDKTRQPEKQRVLNARKDIEITS